MDGEGLSGEAGIQKLLKVKIVGIKEQRKSSD